MKGRVTAVVGAQYGSEGKGAIVQHIANDYNTHVRTGGPNAGHTIHHEGVAYPMQVIPCGWINPNARLIIGVGALIDIEQLREEIRWIKPHFPEIEDRLFIDARAGHLDPVFMNEEGGVEGDLHKRIGSTGKGVGAAREARMARDPRVFELMDDALLGTEFEKCLHYDTARLLHASVNDGEDVLLEGAQGSGLSMIHGPWPYVTSCDTNAAQVMADCGLPPGYITDTILVARTFPIRVAGNSGPLQGETDWDSISARIGQQVEERTTVTKKVRRVGTWDSELFLKACQLNGPTEIAITFMDYLYPECQGASTKKDLGSRAMGFVEMVETLASPAKVKYLCTGPKPNDPDQGVQMVKL